MDWTMPESPESSVSGDNAAGGPSTEPAKAPLALSRIRTNHLGVPIKASTNRKVKYQHTLTVVFDAGTVASLERDDESRVWRLLQDTRTMIDGTVRGLRRLFEICKEAAPATEQSLLTERAFKFALTTMYGARDTVLIQRLFEEFSEEEEDDMPPRIDLRHFVRQFVSINREPIETRLELLFEIWDLDDSSTLKFAELADHVVHDLPVYKRDRAIETFSRVWTHIRGFAIRENDGFLNSSNSAPEVTKENLIDACSSLPIVAHFFEEFMTRWPPKANSSALWTEDSRRRMLLGRMTKLDAEVRMEVRNEGRPKTAPAQQHKIDPRLVGAGTLVQQRRGSMRAGMKAPKRRELSFDDDADGQAKDGKKPEKRDSGSSKALGSMQAANAAALGVLKPNRINMPLPDNPGRPASAVNRRAANRKYHSFIASSSYVPNPVAKPLSSGASAAQLSRPAVQPKLTGSRSEPALAAQAVPHGRRRNVQFAVPK